MREFLLRRLVQVVPTILGLLVLIFLVSRVMPGDPVRLALGPEATKAQIAAYQEKLGLDRPLPGQFTHYVAGLLRGDLGESIRTSRDVRRDIGHFLPATVELLRGARDGRPVADLVARLEAWAQTDLWNSIEYEIAARLGSLIEGHLKVSTELSQAAYDTVAEVELCIPSTTAVPAP